MSHPPPLSTSIPGVCLRQVVYEAKGKVKRMRWDEMEEFLEYSNHAEALKSLLLFAS
jgi:hypothetical protein